MKAVIQTEYGSPEVLQVKEVDKPVPMDNEVLVKVIATTVTSGDARLRALRVPFGFKLLVRLMFGFTKPRNGMLGGTFAGVVEAVGKDVTLFQVGDSVYGAKEGKGAHAEYLAVAEDAAVAQKPSNISFEQAAAVPFGALTSLIYLRDFGNIRSGQKILINGASGSLGVYAVQLAKHFGADVTGVCSSANIELVSALGADQVIDYTIEDFTQGDKTYDIIYDTVGVASFGTCKRVLRRNGRCLMAVASIPQYVQMLWTKLFGSKKLIAGVALFRREELLYITELLEGGELAPVVDRRYTLEQIVDAHRYVDGGHKKGGVVITVAPDANSPYRAESNTMVIEES